MLIVGILLFVLMVACMAIATDLHAVSMTVKDSGDYRRWQNREVTDKKRWNISMALTIISTLMLGVNASLLIAKGLRSIGLFEQLSSIGWLVLGCCILRPGYKILKDPILEWEKGYWKWIVTIIIVALPISVGAIEMCYQAKTETIKQTKTEVIETVQLDPDIEIITTMHIKGEGDVYAFCYINENGNSSYDTVPARKSEITYIDANPYLEESKVSTIITAAYPNGKVEERVVYTDMHYMFYCQKEN